LHFGFSQNSAEIKPKIPKIVQNSAEITPKLRKLDAKTTKCILVSFGACNADTRIPTFDRNVPKCPTFSGYA